MLKKIVVVAISAVLATGVADKGCAPEQPDGNTKSNKAVAQPPANQTDTVSIWHSIGGEPMQRLAINRNIAGKLWERTSEVTSVNATKKVDFGASHTFEGPLSCALWYIVDNKAYLVDSQQSTSAGGGVACASNSNKLRSTFLKVEPQDIKDCKCTVGNRTYVLRVEWDY